MASRRVLVVAAVLAAAALLIPVAPASAAPGDATPVQTGIDDIVDGVRTADGAVWVLDHVGTLGRFTPPDRFELVPVPGIQEGNDLTVGPDGNLWITAFHADDVARVDPDTREVDVFPTTGADGPIVVTAGPDGGVWVAGQLSDTLVRLDPVTGAATSTVSGVLDQPATLLAGPDGNLWFANGTQFARLTLSNGFQQSFNPTGMTGLAGMAVAPDNTLWLSGRTNDTIGRVDTTTGAVSVFTATGIDGPLAFGRSNGQLWVVGRNNATVGRVTTGTGAVAAFALPGVDNPNAVAAFDADRMVVVAENDLGLVNHTTGALLDTVPPNAIDLPQGAVAGPDGDIWMNAFADDRVVRFDRTTGAVTPVSLFGVDGPHEIALGPDGNLWVTGRNSNTIARIDPDTADVDTFPTTGVNNPRGVTAGPDGNVWIVGRDNDSVGRIVPSTGAITAFPMPDVDQPRQIVAGPDGNLYTAGSASDTIARVTPATGEVQILNELVDAPFGLVIGPDDKLWVTTTGAPSQVLRLGLDGTVEDFVSLPDGSSPVNIVNGPDGNLWIAAQGTDELVRVTPFFGIQAFSTTGLVDGPIDIAVAPDNQLWVGGELDDRVATFRTFSPHGFSDVGANAFFQDGLEWARSEGLVTGFNDGTYRPTASVLRGQIANMLWNLMDAPEGSPPHGFVDVRATGGFADAIDWAKAEGLVNGFPGNRYKPNDPVNRGQLVNMVWNMVGQPGGSPSHGFVDVPAGAFYEDALDWAKDEGLVNGFPGNRYKPTDPVNRGQVVSILYNLARNPAAWNGLSGPAPSTVLFQGDS